MTRLNPRLLMWHPYGTRPLFSTYPALKRWAIVFRPTKWDSFFVPGTETTLQSSRCGDERFAESASRDLSSPERQQRDVARLLDSVSQAPLVRSAYAGQAPRHDLPGLRDKS